MGVWNPETRRAYQREYYRANRGNRAENSRQWRRRVKAAWFYSTDRVCHICGKEVTLRSASRDHLIPRALGGPDVPANIALAHMHCNRLRGDRMKIAEYLVYIERNKGGNDNARTVDLEQATSTHS